MGYLNEKKSYNYVNMHSNKFDYFKYLPQKYTGDIINDINEAKIYELVLDESIDLTLNYLKEIQSNLYNIKHHQAYKLYKPHTRSL